MKNLVVFLSLAGLALGPSLQARGQSEPPAVSDSSNQGKGSSPEAEAGPVGQGSWARAASLATGRSFHTANLLPDGNVMVAGGCIEHGPLGVCSKVTASTELFNPDTGKWANGKAMKFARFGHTATPLPDGGVLVVGGCHEAITGGLVDCAKAHRSAEIYDPDRKVWDDAGEMKVSRNFHTAALISAMPLSGCGQNCGKVLLFGNSPESNPGVGTASPDSLLGVGTASPEIFDPREGTWSQIEPPNSVGGNCCTPLAVPLHTGEVLIVGLSGSNVSKPFLPKGSLLFNSSDAKWRATSTESILRFSGTATLLNDGTVLTSGGAAPDRPEPKAPSAEIYDPTLVIDPAKPDQKGGWRPTGRMSVGRLNHTATLLESGEVLVAGGGHDAESINEANAAAGKPNSIPKLVDSAELFDPRRGTWEPTGKMVTGRGDDSFGGGGVGRNWRPPDFTATRLRDGRVLVVGGAILQSFDATRPLSFQPKLDLDLAEIYQPAQARSSQPTETRSSKGGAGKSVRLQDWRIVAGIGGLILIGVWGALRRIRLRKGH